MVTLQSIQGHTCLICHFLIILTLGHSGTRAWVWVSNGYTSKHSWPYWSNPPFSWHWDTLALRPECQSARTSKKKCFIYADQYIDYHVFCVQWYLVSFLCTNNAITLLSHVAVLYQQESQFSRKMMANICFTGASTTGICHSICVLASMFCTFSH